MSQSQQQFKSFSSERIFSQEELAILVTGAALEKKAEQPTILDLTHLNVFAQYFVLLTAANTRQAYAVADSIKVFLKKHFQLSPFAMDGLETSTWILLDYGFIFIHVFIKEIRDKYQLELLWSKGRQVNLDPERIYEIMGSVNNDNEAQEI